MNWSKAFVALDTSTHDRSSFDSREAELNVFIHTKAAKHMVSGISQTMVLPTSTVLPNGKYNVCSFFTVAPSSISRETLPQNRAKKLPHYPVPVFLLAQLAVHRDYHGQGLGKITLIKALEYLWHVNDHMKAFAIVVDCLNDQAKTFYLKYGFESLCEQNGKTRLFIPMKTVADLFKKD